MERIFPQLNLNAVLDSSITPGVWRYAFLTSPIALGGPRVTFLAELFSETFRKKSN